jgi:hypothetical protein
MKYVFTLVVLVISSFGFAQKPIEVPTIAFKVPLGETVQFDDVAFSLIEIVEDSRCPSEVTCVWEGRAKVTIKIEEIEKGTSMQDVLFQNSRTTVVLETETQVYRAIKLSPYPTSSTKNKMAYEVFISATHKKVE